MLQHVSVGDHYNSKKIFFKEEFMNLHLASRQDTSIQQKYLCWTPHEKIDNVLKTILSNQKKI